VKYNNNNNNTSNNYSSRLIIAAPSSHHHAKAPPPPLCIMGHLLSLKYTILYLNFFSNLLDLHFFPKSFSSNNNIQRNDNWTGLRPKNKRHMPNSKMTKLHNPDYSKDLTWRESHINDDTYKQIMPSPKLGRSAHVRVRGRDIHPLPPRSPPKSPYNHPSPPRGSGGRRKKPPRSWGIHDRGLRQLLLIEIYKSELMLHCKMFTFFQCHKNCSFLIYDPNIYHPPYLFSRTTNNCKI
jgi:hypothetical protein